MFCDFKEVLGENVLFFLKTRQKVFASQSKFD
jgi:hypothetical protein